ncbi:glycosyltransferase family 2 protein [uncultured Litoreibacter sp.]|uniref:glycosyltransferase family 2 protein n=1 Tax=uncultured Litoreibacter sp. TaxID=1392394 RepID=UPI00262067B7|nr:glycosyltransferase family 2 protein [uncultured Litoreibacter sp.]
MGCVIVTYNSAEHILGCLHSLAQAEHVTLRIVIVDNSSSDRTPEVIQGFLDQSDLDLTLVQSAQNLGFAAGVNLGLTKLLEDPDLDRFWILNPDCTVPSSTPAKFAKVEMPFSLIGGRIIYEEHPSKIQIDGGQINTWTGATTNIHIGQNPDTTAMPKSCELDFISGASMVASRAFILSAGLMPEQYFLYYEEVSWAQNRGEFPLVVCENASVLHSAGASIGSPTLSRGPSALSVYYKHRSRMMFMIAHHPLRVPVAYLFGWGKLLQHLKRGQYAAIPAILRAMHGLPLRTE